MTEITIKVPLAQRELANRISRALEPDVGGYHVFDSLADDTHAIAQIPTCEHYVANFLELHLDAAALHAFVAADYANRWPEFDCPTLAEVGEFCAAVECYVDDAQQGAAVSS